MNIFTQNYSRLNGDSIDDLLELCNECFPVKYSRDNIRGLLINSNIYTSGVIVSNKLVGFVMGSSKFFSDVLEEDLTQKNEFTQLPRHSKISYLMLLGVTNSYRRQKLGSFLLDQYITWAKSQGSQAIYLHTHSYNLSALEFYRNHGFLVSHEIPAFYHFDDAEQPALMMYKILNCEEPSLMR
ncbi:N-alpha-acetyltransferase 60 [Thelohanellus kitauei]|uniref:N-alpha-acetyltransferase 60 n=1 Tax=Thelohanellus kitauei TaxID=669202 RepID=A0A0C2JA13_THEKT|nr:N-alpha-acetyltransferase 60 [Thelohanellus kitauei]